MASVFKRYDAPGAKWYCSYYTFTVSGARKRRIHSTGTTEHKIAKQIAAKYEAEAAARFHGVVDVRVELMQKNARLKITEQLDAFADKMKRKASTRSEKNAKQTRGYIEKYADFAGITTIGEISADDANRYKATLLEQGLSSRTVQAQLNALKHFARWLYKTGKLASDPLVTVESPNPKQSRKFERRMLLPTEWPWLVRGVDTNGFARGMQPEARKLLYRVAIQTGLRASELRALKRGNFHLDQSPPFVRLSSTATKNSQAARQYVDEGLANDLRGHLSRLHPNSPAFHLPSESRVVDMIRDDLESARNCWLDEVKDSPDEYAKRTESDFLAITNGNGEVFDFHCLRHTCGAWLASKGVQPKVIQSVMRHSTITLTMDAYGHLFAGVEAAAIAGSAELTAIPLLATGTSDAKALPRRFHQGCMDGAFSMLDSAKRSTQMTDLYQTKKPQIPRENAALCESMHVSAKAEGTGLEPATGKPATDFESASIRSFPSVSKQNSSSASIALPLVQVMRAIWPDLTDAQIASEIERLEAIYGPAN